MELTKQDKKYILDGLISESIKVYSIIEKEEKKIRANSNTWEEAKDWIKDSHIINFYKKEDKRIKDLMIMFGYKEIDNCDADDDSYEEEKTFNQRAEEYLSEQENL